MKFELKPLSKSKKPYFEIEIDYEHGDSDSHNTVKSVLKSSDLKDLELYITAFEEMSKAISDNRSERKDFPEKYKDKITAWDFSIKVEGLGKSDVSIEWQKDVYCRDDMLAYFADMNIMRVIYCDEKGNKFEVTWY